MDVATDKLANVLEFERSTHHADGVKMLVDEGQTMVPRIDLPNGEYESNTNSTNGADTSPELFPELPPIAICGMAMRLPGGVNCEEEFWDLLVNKRDGKCRVPADRYNVDAFHSRASKSGVVKTEHGYFLDDLDLQHFDASFFSMTRNELEKLDPQHRLLLEVTRECLENAGETNWRGKDIGCYVGVFGEDWLDLHAKDTQDSGMYRITGYGDFLLGNRVSYEYDFKGPSVTVKTGCSSSLICLHMACQALQAGEITSAIVGGSNLIMSPTMTIAMTEQGILSPTGSCKTFDADADGYGRGEAINTLYVKRLDDAIRDGNPIRAIIRGSSTNCDGKTPGISHPSSEGHESLIRRAYEVAGLHDYGRTAFVECHGTGTAIGDPLETTAIGNVFGEKGVYIGSVKPNVGHSEGASGLTAVIKTVLALEKRTIPPNINFNKPNPKIPFKQAKLQVPVDSIPWPEDRHERAGVNSFGIGGANAHIILDSAASFAVSQVDRVESKTTGPKSRLLVFSANNIESARKGASNYLEYLGDHSDALPDVAYTLGNRREHLPYRTFSVADGISPIEFCPPSKAPSAPPSITFVFTGQGVQWATMGMKLAADFPSVREDFRIMDEVLLTLSHAPTWSIEGESRVDQAEFSQPLCAAVQIAIVNLLSRWGVHPSSVVGHSSGETAAAYASGAISFKEAIIGAYLRGLATKQQTRPGAMAAVGLGRDDLTPFLMEGVIIACENSPISCTISGDRVPLDAIIENIKESVPDVPVRRLRVERAYHSHHMKDIGETYENLLKPHISSVRPHVPFFSSVSNEVITTQGSLNAPYWRKNLELPVLFNTAVEKLLSVQTSNNLFLEIGPHSGLAGPLRQILKVSQPDASYLPTLIRDQDDTKSMLSAVGQLFLKGIPVNFSTITPGGSVLTNLPRYPWNHETRYWDESRLAREWRLRKFPRHDILGSRIAEGSEMEPTWRNMLRLDDVPWIRDHMISSDIVFPAAGYIAMAVEAIRQVTGTEDCSLRNVSISAAMILHESGVATETLLHLRPVRLTMNLDSVWYEFSILSYNGTSWTKHCSGQVRAGQEHSEPAPEISDQPRKVPSSRWYQTMRNVGLNYGPRFQGLESISVHPVDNIAVARVSNNITEHESPYQLHPATLDFCLQLFSAAASNGQARHFGKLSVPTYLGELYMKKSSTEVTLQVNAVVSAKGAINGSCIGTAGGEVILQLRDVKLSPLEDDDANRGQNPHAGVRLHWKPHIDFQDTAKLIKSTKHVRDPYPIVQKLVLLCSAETRDRLAVLDTELEYLKKFRSWLDLQVQRAQTGGYEFVDDAKSLLALPSTERVALIYEAANIVQNTEAANIGTAVMRIFEASESIFKGETEPLELLLKNEVLTKLYDFADGWTYKEFLDLLTHRKPNLRVLEIGAGTGATTAAVLQSLVSEYGERMFYSYTYTDVSAGFFVAAKERFQDVPHMEFSVLDISQDPAQQGFEVGSYDLIIAANVLHATANIGETLKNVRKLLQPEGKLLLQELCSSTKWINFIMGVLPGWWLGEADGRGEEPYITPEKWTEELSLAGFSGAEAVVYDDEAPFQTNATIIASPSTKTMACKRITILTNVRDSPIATELAAVSASQGLSVDFCGLYETPKQNQDIISLLDLEDNRSFLADITAEQYGLLKAYLSNLTSAGMLWLTKASQMDCSDPQYSQILGLARTLRNELSVDLATLEIDNLQGIHTMDSILKVFAKFQLRSKDLESDPDFEYALSNGTIHIPRFHWISVADELSSNAEETALKRLEIGKRGSLKTLQWVQRPQIVLVDDEVSVDIRAVGMNFKDILIAMGVVDGNKAEGNGLGCESSGIITNVGPAVKDLKIGDRVIVFAGNSYSTVLKTTSKLCCKMPDDLTFEDGATMPCVYGTVIHGLIDVARLEKDQTVLIHSACGGIGIAAIQICNMIGAKVFATVGNDEKAQYLMDTFKIPRSHIFKSRNSSFLQDVMRETNGVGVDVVLNSLSGDLLHASWKCVAEFGKMVEIGKSDFIGQGRLAMDVFEANRSFFGVDLAQICADRPAMIKRLLEKCMKYFQQGAIKPIRPTKFFDAVQIEEAFRYMQKGQHIGKIVVRIPEDHSSLPAANVHAGLTLRPNVSYLLVGGLGGLGRSISAWMVEHGARHLVYLSRSGGTGPDDATFVRELEAQGCTVQIVAGSVANLADVQDVISKATAPIAGIIQMSMVLRDGGFPQMSHEDWEAVCAPKVQGTWNLHNAFSAETLDFFVLFSSFSGLVGQWGQANYASANTFLDSFVQYRHSQGLPASVLDIGAMDDVGYVSQNPAVMEQFRATAVHVLREQDLLDSLELVIAKSTPSKQQSKSYGYVNNSQVGIGLKMTMPISATNNRSIWKRDVRMSLYRNLENAAEDEGGATSNEGLKEFMSSVANNPRILNEPSSVEFLAQEIGNTLFSFMMKPIEEMDTKQSLVALGVDSLVAIELRNWCRQRIGLELSVLEIMGASSIEKLGHFAAEGLLVKHGCAVRDGDTFLLMKAP